MSLKALQWKRQSVSHLFYVMKGQRQPTFLCKLTTVMLALRILFKRRGLDQQTVKCLNIRLLKQKINTIKLRLALIQTKLLIKLTNENKTQSKTCQIGDKKVDITEEKQTGVLAASSTYDSLSSIVTAICKNGTHTPLTLYSLI